MRKALKIFMLLIILLLITGCFDSKKDKVVIEKEKVITAQKISYSKLNDIVTNYSEHVNTDIVDVRSEDEYEEGHILGSINIPYDELYDIIIDTNREIIIYADTPTKSKQAAKDLVNIGYRNVKYIAGINNWPYSLEN